jgi:hypothetical protein
MFWSAPFFEFWGLPAAGIARLERLFDVFRHAADAVRTAADLRLKSRLRFQAMVTNVHSPEALPSPRK